MKENPHTLDYWGAGVDLITYTSFPMRNQIELLPDTQQSSGKLKVLHFEVIIRYRLQPLW